MNEVGRHSLLDSFLDWLFFSTEPTRILTKAPNALGLQAGQIEREALEKYKSARKNIHLYRAAARLWARVFP